MRLDSTLLEQYADKLREIYEKAIFDLTLLISCAFDTHGIGYGKIVLSSLRDCNFEIYSMNADGTKQINLTKDPGYDNYPALSAEGNRIVFASTRSGTMGL